MNYRGMFAFLKSQKKLSTEQHAEFVEAIQQLATALQSLTEDREPPMSIAATHRTSQRAVLADQKSRRVKSLMAQYESEQIELLQYRCLLHAAKVNCILLVQDFAKWAAEIKEDMRKLKKIDRSYYETMRVLYGKSFRVGVVEDWDGQMIIPDFALPIRPEAIFD